MDMKSRIELELRGKDRQTIKELNLDCCRGIQIEGLNSDFKSLESLSLINSGLTSLRGFPMLPNLQKLELSDNRLNNGLENLIQCTALTHLNLSGNKFKDLNELAPLAKLNNLKNLDLFNCEVTKIDDYRKKVFSLIPNLKFLDGFDAENQEDEDEDDEDYDIDDDEDDSDEASDDDSDDDEDDDDDDDDEDLDEDLDEDENLKEDGENKPTE